MSDHEHVFEYLFTKTQTDRVPYVEGYVDDDSPVRVRGQRVSRCACGEVRRETFDEIISSGQPPEGVGYGP